MEGFELIEVKYWVGEWACRPFLGFKVRGEICGVVFALGMVIVNQHE
jgi:hypothetical protein